MAATQVLTEQVCDFNDHHFTGEVFESRTGNWLVAGDMVCVMHSCAEHAHALAAHPRSWWEAWLQGEGASYGYISLS
ncbi:MAG: hypothetical protein ACRD0H_06590 [Actinomycetes bacterium]